MHEAITKAGERVVGKVYVDTNVYLDYWGGRADRLRPLGEFAFQFIKRIINCEFELVVSSFVLFELSKQLSEKEINSIFELIKEKKEIAFVEKSKEDVQRAKQIAREKGVPWHDVLHCLLAKKGGAETMITRDRHFERLSGLIEPVFPENA